MFGAIVFAGAEFSQVYPAGSPIVAMPTEVLIEAELAGFGNGWTSLTDDLTDDLITPERTFQSDEPDDLVMEPPSCTFGLRNDVNNSARVVGLYSPDSGHCRAGFGEGIRVRLRRRGGVTLRDRFLGFVDMIAPLLGSYEEQTVQVTATGWLKLAATTLVSGVTAQINQRGDQLAQTVTSLAAFAPPALRFATGLDTYPYALDDLDPTQNTIIDAYDSITKSGLDRIWEKADGTLVYEARSTRLGNPSNLATVTDTAPAGMPGYALSGGTLRRELAAIYNRAQVTGHPRAIDGSAVVLYGYPVSASNPSIDTGATVTVQGAYVDPSQLAQQVGGFNMLVSDGVGGAVIGVSGSLPTADFQFFSGPNGTGSDVSNQVAVSVVYEARQATFTIVNGSGAPAYYYRLQCRGQGIYDYIQATGRDVNTTSLGAFGGKTLRLDCPYQTDPTFLQALASYVVSVYGVGISRFDQGVTMEIPADDQASTDALLSRDISDPIAVSEAVSGIAAGPYWINGVKEQYDARGNLTLTWLLARRLTANTWQIETVGKSEIEQTTRVSFF